jgi:hypothetical protein
MKEQSPRRRWLMLLFTLGVAVSCERGCQGCSGPRGCQQKPETCEQCVDRCVTDEGISPDLCRTVQCASICRQQ